MDQKGYVISSLSFLLIIPAICIVATFINMTHTGSQSQALSVQSDVVLSTASDVENNIPPIAEKVLQKTANDLIKSGCPLQDSRSVIKNSLQEEMDNLNEKYTNEGINATCKIISVDTGEDPFNVEINSTISVNKDNAIHKENISQNISIIDPNYPLPDPLPFIKCKKFGGVTNTSTRIVYGASLVNYLKNENMSNAEVYLNATSPLIIKKCPYDPYKSHGQSNNLTNLKNCIDNGYYHDSNDGACYLCRLEGKAICIHFGMETFIIPSVSSNETLPSGPCGSDHAIFNDHYEGYSSIYRSNSTGYYKIFLENGHRSKYGLI
ncbi:MAG TPA: hypothetical protein VK426_01435 [Methanobacterium sp.]|nr:hypothetical protein [Methanobacterium sp.]